MRKHIYTLLIMAALVHAAVGQNGNSVSEPREENIVVGAIGGTVDVTALGGASYSIPIQVPEGIGGIQPNLSVVYNSQSGNGLLGWGWTLGGLSAITRVGQTLYHDNNLKGVDFNNDRFSLDGQRLMVVNGLPDGADGAEYRTEIDQMAKIVSYSCDTTFGPAYFKVWYSNGNIAYYGSKRHSRIGLQQRNDVCIWLLDSVVDRNGNYMSYRYCRGGANYFLTDIRYTGNSHSGVLPLYAVKLDYDIRPDEETVFIGNNALHQSMILKCVTMFNTMPTKEMRLWQYDFSYTGGYDRELYKKLSTITFSGGGEKYKSTTVNWGTDASQYSENVFGHTGDGSMNSSTIKFPGDFNGDGYTDMITVEKNASGSGKTARVYLNGRDDSGNVVFSQIKKYTLDENITWIYVADFDGDGLDDFMFANRERRGYWWQRDIVTLNIYLTRRNTSGGLVFVLHNTPSSDYRLASDKRDVLILGDFHGEGKTSFILEISKDDGKETDNGKECDTANQRADRSYYVRYNKNLQRFVEDEFSDVLGANVYYPADYDGDGKTEILYSYQQNGYTSTAIVKLVYSNGRYRFQEHYNDFPTNWVYCYPGDFNGDGHMDALFRFNRDDPDGEWRVYLFKQNQFLWKNYFCWDIGHPINDDPINLERMIGTKEYLRVGDFNGDGKADIMYPNPYQKTIVCFGPMRDNSVYPPYSYRQVIDNYPYFSTANVCYGNFLGKESLQYLGYLEPYGLRNEIRHIHPVSNRYNAESIVDGMSNRVEFEYDYLMPALSGDHADDFFTLDDSQTNAGRYIFSRPMPIKALRKFTAYNSEASTPHVETQYRYSNVMVHTRGHGVLGFTDITAESYVANVSKGKTKQHFSTSELGDRCQIVLKETKAYGPVNNLIQQTLHRYLVCQNTRNTKVFMPLGSAQAGWHYSLDDAHGFEKQTLSSNSYQTDSDSPALYSNVVHCVKSYQCINRSQLGTSAIWLPWNYTYRTVVEHGYDDQLSDWIVSRPKSVLTTAEGNASEGNDDVKSLVIYEYEHPTHPMLPSKVATYPSGVHPDALHFGNDQLATLETLVYNTNGTVKEKSLSALHNQALPVVATKYGYNNGFQFLENVTNTKGYVTRYQYDVTGYGWLKSETDCNGLQTIYQPRPLGTSHTTILPDMTRTKMEKMWVVSGDAHAPARARYKEVATQTDTNGQTITTASTYYDAAGRCLRTLSYGLDGRAIYTDTQYNSQGLVEKVSAPYFQYSEDEAKWTEYQYDSYGRTISTSFPDNTSQSVDYNGLMVKHTVHPSSTAVPSQTVIKAYNVAGWLTESTDPGQTKVKYAYYADGSLKYAQVGNDPNTRVSMEYDDAGNRTKLTDPDYGTVVSSYNAYGQLESSTNPKHATTRYEYDSLGRVHLRTEQPRSSEPVVTVWNYCDTGTEKGLLQSVEYNNNEQVLNYKYDNLNRVSSATESYGGSSLTTNYQYEPTTGRLYETTYPTGYKVRRKYGEFGHLRELTDAQGRFLWHTRQMNAMGQITRYMTGNYVSSTLNYDDDTHRLRGIETQVVAKSQNILQDLWYDYDDFGNLAARKDNFRNLEETFTYDHLNRLDSIKLNGVHTGRMAYDALGRMTDKMADRQTVFASARYDYVGPDGQLRPHAISRATVEGNPFPAEQLDIDYTMFDKVSTIAQSGNSQQTSLSYTYGYDRQRIHMEEKIGNYTLREKRYGDHCEFMTENRYTMSRTFLSGPMGVFAVVEHNGDNDEIHYVYKDNLGSWTTITDAGGFVEREQSFDAWGNLRNPDTWSGTISQLPMFDRGYTGHEHLYSFGLINMNGRVYDPVMSSFLSPDNYIQAPDFSQNFNRYAYCLNNPLRYTDPSGESIVLAAVVGAFWGAMINLAVNFDYASTDVGFVNTVTLGALGGAVGGVAGFGAGSLATGLFASAEICNPILVQGVSGAASGFAGGFAGTSVTSWCTGASFGDGLLAGLKAGAISGAICGGLGALQGGLQYYQEYTVYKRGCYELGLERGEPIPSEMINDGFLAKARSVWYPDAPMESVDDYTVDKVTLDNMKEMTKHKQKASTTGIRENGIITGRSTVKFNRELAFSSPKQLYYTMGHEFIHVSQFAALQGLSGKCFDFTYPFKGFEYTINDVLDYYAYSFEHQLGNSTIYSVPPEVLRAFSSQFSQPFSLINHMNFGWALQSINNSKFVYPFFE